VIKAFGHFVVFHFEGSVYPGNVSRFNEGNQYVSTMVKSLKSQNLPETPDIPEYELSDVLGAINPPKLVSKKGSYSIRGLTTFFEFGLSVNGLWCSFCVLYNICSLIVMFFSVIQVQYSIITVFFCIIVLFPVIKALKIENNYF
jgi:hypothetical protein